MNSNKICPDCKAEYFPHVETCADCGAVLLLHEEYGRAQEERMRVMAAAIENAVAVREGDLKWLRELSGVLVDAGIPCTIAPKADCAKGCQSTYLLIISSEDLERAQERIAEYFMEIHPELRASHALISQGRCPACGSAVGADDKECSDCGLTLLIFEDDNQDTEGRGQEGR